MLKSHLGRTDFLKLNLTFNDKNVGQKCFSADFSSFLGLSNMLTAEEFSETGPLMRFGNNVFRSQ